MEKMEAEEYSCGLAQRFSADALDISHGLTPNSSSHVSRPATPPQISEQQPTAINAKEESILTALDRKYSTSSMGSLHCEIFMPQKLLGKTISGSLVVPRTISLDCQNINTTGDYAAIEELCRNVTELDIAKNQFVSWDQIFYLVDAVPSLEFINVSGNPLELIPTTRAPDAKQCPGLRKLVMNFCKFDWVTVNYVLQVFPNLIELYLSHNKITDTSGLRLEPYPSLAFLQLTSNSLSKWTDVCQLGRVFPGLSLLILADNPIQTLGESSVSAEVFQKLSTLNLNQTLISDWDELGKLGAISQLKDIRIQGIPLVESFPNEKSRRELIVATLPNVCHVNGGLLMPGERGTAERAYLRYFENKERKPNRFNKLFAKHGAMPELADVDLSAGIQQNARVRVIVEDRGVDTHVDISLDDTVSDLRKVLCRTAGVPISNARTMKLFSESRDEEMEETSKNTASSVYSALPTELVYSTVKRVSMYHLSDGDVLTVILRPS